MSRFRKVASGTWGDERFRSLSESAQRLWFYLLTGPEVTSLPGLVVVGRAGLAEALGWSPAKLDRCFAELTSAVNDEGTPMAVADWKSRVVWLPKGYKHNPPANTNVILGWKDLWRAVPECEIKREAMLTLKQFAESLGDAYAAAFESVIATSVVRRPQVRDTATSASETVPPTVSDTNLEPTGEQSLARARTATAPSTASALPEGVQGESGFELKVAEPDPVRVVFEHYLGLRKRHRPNKREPKLKPQEITRANAMLKAGYSVDDLILACEGLFMSPNHLGENDRGMEYLEFFHAFGPKVVDGFIERASAARQRRQLTEAETHATNDLVTPLTPEQRAEAEKRLAEIFPGIEDQIASIGGAR